MADDAGVLNRWFLPPHVAAASGSGADAGGVPGDEISKKELLQLTGLSYGQLYRWKRMNLIPEHWFIHRATFTGQETFFPRALILERIATIQRLKDRYSLEEIAELLSPASSARRYSATEIERNNLCPAQGLAVVAAVYQSAGREKAELSPELCALLRPDRPGAETPVPPGEAASPAGSVPDRHGEVQASAGRRGERRASNPASYSFLDLVAGVMASELLERGLAPPAVKNGVETFLAGASQFPALDQVHLVCAEMGDPPQEFSALYSGSEPIVFGHGVNVTADVAVGPIAESLRKSLQSLYA